MAKLFTDKKYDKINPCLTKMVYGLFYLLGMIPERMVPGIARAIGRIWYLLDRSHRKVVLENLERAFGDEKSDGERRRIARAAFGNVVMIPFEIGWSLHKDKDQIMESLHVEGLSNLKKAHAKGRGILVLTLHLGNWELLPLSYIANGFPVSVIYRPLDFKPADLFFRQYRGRFGGNLIPKKKSMRQVLLALKKKECVGILLDQDSGLTAGVFADFFGHPACTNKGMAVLAMKNVPVVPTFLVREKKGYKVIIEPEISLIETGDKNRDIQQNTAIYNQALEAIIRQYPEQWLWLHRRWKTRPVKSSLD